MLVYSSSKWRLVLLRVFAWGDIRLFIGPGNLSFPLPFPPFRRVWALAPLLPPRRGWRSEIFAVCVWGPVGLYSPPREGISPRGPPGQSLYAPSLMGTGEICFLLSIAFVPPTSLACQAGAGMAAISLRVLWDCYHLYNITPPSPFSQKIPVLLVLSTASHWGTLVFVFCMPCITILFY